MSYAANCGDVNVTYKYGRMCGLQLLTADILALSNIIQQLSFVAVAPFWVLSDTAPEKQRRKCVHDVTLKAIVPANQPPWTRIVSTSLEDEGRMWNI